MSSASDLVSLEQDTGLVKKMQEREIYIYTYMEFVEANANNDCFNCLIRR